MQFEHTKLLEAVSDMLDKKLEHKLTERKLLEREIITEMKSDMMKLWQEQTQEFYKNIRSS